MLPSVVRAYEQEGHVVRLGSPRLLTSGVFPAGEIKHTHNQAPIPLNDWGMSLRDFYAFLLIGQELRPARALIIGNAFGMSAVSIAELMKPVSVDVIDAEVFGAQSREASDLTRRVARRLNLDVRITPGYSPRDLPGACRYDTYDLIFIDGLHTDAQMIADFEGVRSKLAPRAAVVFHDVGLCRMDKAWAHIRSTTANDNLKPFDLTFTDFGTTVLLRGLPNLERMLASTCRGLRDGNEKYFTGDGFSYDDHQPELEIVHLAPGRRIAFYGSGNDLGPYESFIRANPACVAAILDDNPAKWGTTRFGIEIFDPARLPSLNVNAVVVSTRSAELAVRTRLAHLAPELSVYPSVRRPHPVELHASQSSATAIIEPRPDAGNVHESTTSTRGKPLGSVAA